MTGPLICALLFGDRSRAVEPAEHAVGRRYNYGNHWRAARRGIAGCIQPAGCRLVTAGLEAYFKDLSFVDLIFAFDCDMMSSSIYM